MKLQRKMKSGSGGRARACLEALPLAAVLLPLLLLLPTTCRSSREPKSAVKFEPESNSYSGLTFTFEPRLEASKRVDGLHLEHWHSIMQHSSGLLYEALRGRAHLGELRVLIPYKWRHYNWPILHKPGLLVNRRLRYSDSDVIVGFEDPIYKETPFAVQHDECGQPGLNIRMPISFLEQSNQLSVKLKARQLVREFAAHRYGIFKESGFRNDPMYPPFSSLAGLPPASANLNHTRRAAARAYALDLSPEAGASQSNHSLEAPSGWLDSPAVTIRGFDENWNECSFETNPASGLPLAHAMNCLPYLSKSSGEGTLAASQLPSSLNLMSSDPFSYGASLEQQGSSRVAGFRQLGGSQQAQPVEWRELADSTSWHFCGDNFPQPAGQLLAAGSKQAEPAQAKPPAAKFSFPHNQLSNNKQNVMCQERSAMDVIRASEDFRRNSYSPSTFNILPATNFKFLQEMPPRIIVCVEYAGHLYQSRRLDHGILDAAITKFLAYDLMADSELALVLFGQQSATRNNFRKLEESLSSRLSLYSPPIDPFEEPAKLYSELELSQMEIQAAHSQTAKLVKGTSSFARLLSETLALQLQRSQYDDVGTDVIVVTTGLFVEDELKIEELLKQAAGANRLENLQWNLIIYPSTMLFDTKSRDGFVVLDALESELIVRARLNKLHLIQRLTGAKVHLVREHLDANGDVKMSTLTQFHQIFEHISKGHSWDQTNSMLTLSQQSVEARPAEGAGRASHKLHFQFPVDSSLANAELLVAFIDPKQRAGQQRSGKRFSIRNLELRSPNNQIVLTDAHPFPVLASSGRFSSQALPVEPSAQADPQEPGQPEELELANKLAAGADSALFAYRNQLSLAGFHLKPAHLLQLAVGQSANQSLRLSGLWSLTATSEEPIQTSAVAMAQVDPNGDTLTGNCWIQTYYESESAGADSQATRAPTGSGPLKQIKVFMQIKGPLGAPVPQSLQGRLEIQDELGNIVQNANMLDDGLGTPDMTKGDGIHSQLVQRAHRPGYYRASVELTGSSAEHNQQKPSGRPAGSSSGQDNACCGSSIPTAAGQRSQESTRFLSRQLYCGTFFVEPNNKLNQQRPPRVNNLTVVGVDQENRRVTLRWFEPMLDITSGAQLSRMEAEDSAAAEGPERRLQARSARLRQFNSVSQPLDGAEGLEDPESSEPAWQAGGRNQQQQPAVLSSRYELKLFTDRETIKRAFEAKQEVGFPFQEKHVEGVFGNALAYGGLKELTLRLPQKQEGIYYIAMRVYNNLGVASHMSNIVQFYLKSNLSSEDLEAIYGQATTSDAEGNIYDKNGELLQRAGTFGLANNHQLSSLLKATSALDGFNLLLFFGVVAFVVSVLCISLTACIASSFKSTLNKVARAAKAEDKKAVASGIAGAGSGSSMVSSNCGSSQQSEVTSSGESSGGSQAGSQGGHDVEINKLSIINDELASNPMANFGHLQATHLSQQQQAQLISSQLQAYEHQNLTYQSPQQQQFAGQELPMCYQNPDKSQWLPQHTMVNGYAYATVMHQQQQQQQGDLNQNGLMTPGSPLTSPVQSWPSDFLLSHYDKVKQARERNEPPPVMRLEALEKTFNEPGLPMVEEEPAGGDQSYLVRKKLPSYFNQQLQQQLTSVLKNKRSASSSLEGQLQAGDSSTPALEGLTDSHFGMDTQTYLEQQHQLAPPPPHYIYGTNLNEPSIYSQATNLQQVAAHQHLEQAFYANQDWQQQQQLVMNQEEQIYSSSAAAAATAAAAYHQQEQLQEAHSNSAISEV